MHSLAQHVLTAKIEECSAADEEFSYTLHLQPESNPSKQFARIHMLAKEFAVKYLEAMNKMFMDLKLEDIAQASIQ